MELTEDGLLITHSDSRDVLPTIYKSLGLKTVYTSFMWKTIAIQTKDFIILCEREEDWELVKLLTDLTSSNVYISGDDIYDIGKNSEYGVFTDTKQEFTLDDYFESHLMVPEGGLE